MRALSPRALVIALGYVLGAIAIYQNLPMEIPPSWTVPGGGVIWLGQPIVAFLLPTALLVTNVLLSRLWATSVAGEDRAAGAVAVYDAIMLRVNLFVVAVHGALLLALTGAFWGQAWAARLVPVMLGITMISIGNLLPKTRPNLAIGIRTQRTLSDRAAWISTHRIAGYVVVAGGAVIVLSALVVPRPVGPAMIVLVGPAVFAGTWLLVRLSGRRADA